MNKIVLITGAPASGKTTIARLLAERFPKSLHIQVDRLREMMVNGVELPDHGWTDEATRQFQWARTTTTAMAQLYASQGVDVVIDDVCVPPEFAEHYAALLHQPQAYRVLLLPSASAVVKRLQNRVGPYDAFLIEHIPWLYSYLEPMPKAGWLVLDSSDWTIEQTIQAVLHGIGS